MMRTLKLQNPLYKCTVIVKIGNGQGCLGEPVEFTFEGEVMTNKKQAEQAAARAALEANVHVTIADVLSEPGRVATPSLLLNGTLSSSQNTGTGLGTGMGIYSTYWCKIESESFIGSFVPISILLTACFV